MVSILSAAFLLLSLTNSRTVPGNQIGMVFIMRCDDLSIQALIYFNDLVSLVVFLFIANRGKVSIKWFHDHQQEVFLNTFMNYTFF